MNIFDVRAQLRLKPLYEIPLRVTFYARVSTDKDAQMNSLDNQVAHFTDMIRDNKKWTYVDGYVDEGISGISVAKRERFLDMIEDAEGDKFDLIITKEISRFARNTLDSLQYTRTLLSRGVGVFFQSDNINTLDEDGELRLTIMSALAQDESRKTSNRVKMGFQQAFKQGHVIGNSRIFGYTLVNKRLVIDEHEAVFVRMLFEKYATNQYSMKQLEKLFFGMGYKNHNGKPINHVTMTNIIRNPKYKGYYCANKIRVVDMFTKKTKKLPQDEWVMYKDETGDIVPAIVSEEVWEKANEVLLARSRQVIDKQNIYNHRNLLTGKLFCAHCHVPFYLKDTHRNHQKRADCSWACSNKIKNGTASCPTKYLYEYEIRGVLFDVLKSSAEGSSAYIDKYLAMIAKEAPSRSADDQIAAIEASLSAVQQKKSKLLGYNAEGKLSDDDFLSLVASCNEEASALTQKLRELKTTAPSISDIKSQLLAIRKILEKEKDIASPDMITREIIDAYIERIDVSAENGNIILDITLKTGIQSRKTIVRDFQTGNMRFPILPERKYISARNNRWASDTSHKISVVVRVYA